MRDILGSKTSSGKTEEQTFPQTRNDAGGPRAMVSAPDGTQRPIETSDISIPKFVPPAGPIAAPLAPLPSPLGAAPAAAPINAPVPKPISAPVPQPIIAAPVPQPAQPSLQFDMPSFDMDTRTAQLPQEPAIAPETNFSMGTFETRESATFETAAAPQEAPQEIPASAAVVEPQPEPLPEPVIEAQPIIERQPVVETPYEAPYIETPQVEQAAAYEEQAYTAPSFGTQAIVPLEESAQGERRRYAVEELQHILDEHDTWLQSSGQQGKRANFRNANLQYVILSGFPLVEASFRGADLSFADLSGADLRNADLSEAVLQQSNFSSANVAGATFARADMRTANLEGAHCEAADFTAAGLIGANLSNLNLAGANFEAADMQSASLAGSNLRGASFRSTNMTYANLTQADLAGAQCRDTNFDSAVLDYSILNGASLKGANLNNASLANVDLTYVEDLSMEYQHGLMEQDRAALEQQWTTLRQEQQKLEQEITKVQQRETNVQMEKHKAERLRREAIVERESMQRLLVSAHDVMREHHTHDRVFRYIGAIWFITGMLILTSIILLLNALELKQLNGIELSVVLLGCAGIMALAGITIRRSIKLSKNLKKLLDIYEQGFGSQKPQV